MAADPLIREGLLKELENTRDELEELLQRRDVLIRQAVDHRLPVTTIAESAGLSRMHVYRISKPGD